MRVRDAANGRLGEDKAVSVIPGKSIKFAKLRDRSAPWKWRVQKDGSLKRYLDYVEKIEIEDAHGFFNNLSLVGAIGSMPKGLIVSDEELATIVSGKKDRGYLEREALTPEKFDELKRYTGLELKALVRLVEETERALIEADAESRAADLRALALIRLRSTPILRSGTSSCTSMARERRRKPCSRFVSPPTRAPFWETWRRGSKTSTRLSAPCRRPSPN